METTNPLNLW